MVSIWIDKQKRLLLNALAPVFSSDPSCFAATDLSIQTYGSSLRLSPDVVICWRKDHQDQEQETLMLDPQKPTVTIAILFSSLPLSPEILDIYASAQITYLIGIEPDLQAEDSIPTQIWAWEAGRYKPCLYQLHHAKLGITLWQGSFEGVTRTWLRWRDLQDHLLLTGEERAKQERERADRIGDFLKLLTQQKAQQHSDQPQQTNPHIQLLFPTAVYQRQIEVAEQINPAMIESAYQIRSQDLEGQRQSKIHSGPQGYYTSIYTNHQLYNRQEFKTLSQIVLEFAGEYAGYLGIDIAKYQLEFTAFWININEKYSYHEPHYHKSCFISGVYYLTVSQGSGRFIFHDPRELQRIIDPHFSQRNAINAERVRWQPQPGQIYLFPAWLLHSVEHHLEEADRITVSFNLRLI